MEEKCREVGLECAVSVRSTEGSGDYRLFMFIVGHRESKTDEAMRALKKILPGDHWPDAIDFVKSLPLSPHGKLDRIALESYVPSKPEKYCFKTFVEFWNLFSNGAQTSKNPRKGFVASGGNSFTAVLMINSLKDAGFPDNPNLLLALLKDEPVDKCWSMLLPVKKVRCKKKRKGVKGERNNKPSTTKSNIAINIQSQTKGNRIDTGVSSISDNLTVDETNLACQTHTEVTNGMAPEVVILEQKVIAEPNPSCLDLPVDVQTSQLPMPSTSMALKGRVWPQDLSTFDPVWAFNCHNIQKSWSVDLLKCVDASPLGVVKNDCGDCFIIVGSHSGLVAVLKCGTGQIISQTKLPDRVEASACLSSDHSFYYIGCYDGSVYRICISDGKIVWSFKTQDQVKSTCVLHLGKLYVGSYDKHIYALSEGGDLFWKQLVGPVTIPVLPFQSSIFVGTLCNKVLRLSTNDGSILRKIVISSPLFSNLVLTTYPGHQDCVLVSPVDGPVQWREAENLNLVEELIIPGQKFSSPVVVSDQLTIIASDKTIYFLQFLKTLWSYEFHERIVSTPFVIGSRLVVITIDGTLHILDDKGLLICTYKLPGEVFSSPIVIESRVFVGCRDNNFYCLNVS
uniref:Pyrrolo-quinoline quinone repeat domain-containing protein n=1 Tax=Lygus hesperus TaxID=30085 RepID=A0A0K8SXI1_LYGHE